MQAWVLVQVMHAAPAVAVVPQAESVSSAKATHPDAPQQPAQLVPLHEVVWVTQTPPVQVSPVAHVVQAEPGNALTPQAAVDSLANRTQPEAPQHPSQLLASQEVV
jgi:hypothetical protein